MGPSVLQDMAVTVAEAVALAYLAEVAPHFIFCHERIIECATKLPRPISLTTVHPSDLNASTLHIPM